MDRALDLYPLLEYIQWYSEMGKPYLFGGRLMIVSPHMTRLGQPSHPLTYLPSTPEPKLHFGDSSYHPDMRVDDYFQGLLGYKYHLEFDIFNPLPP